MASGDPGLMDAAAQLLSCCPEAAFVVGGDGRVLAASDAAQSLLGDGGDMVGASFRELCSLPVSVSLPMTAATPPTPIHIRRSDGSRIAHELVAFPFPRAAATALFAIIRPLALSYERARQLHRLSAAGALTRAVAHDLNNLFQLMVLSADALTATTAADMNGEALKWVQQIQTALEASRGLTRKILQATTLGTSPVIVDAPLTTTVRDVVDVLGPLLGSATELRSVTPSSALVRHDPDAIFQLLMNLVINARQAMPNGGVVVVEVEDQEAEDVVRLSVTDDGVGMTEEVQARVFERFFTTSDGGTGLGLATVAEIAQRHEARVSVDSSPGKGTRVAVVFPTSS